MKLSRNSMFSACLFFLLLGCGKAPEATHSPEASSSQGSNLKVAVKSTPLPAPEIPKPPVHPAKPKRGTKINPVVLRKFVLNDDISVLKSLNNVYVAKEEISRAHANLLPSINIGAMISSIGTFGLGGISFLLPFLAPSNWYNLDVRKQQFAASGYAFYLVELNEYASAYSLYLSMLADEEIQTHVLAHYENNEQIRLFVESQFKQGLVTEEKLQQATASRDLAHMQLLQLNSSIGNSRASLRRMLGFGLDKEFFLEDHHPAEISVENRSPMEVLKLVFEKSPEVRQVDSLIAAAQDGAWAAPFGFIGGGSANLNLSGGGGGIFGGGSIGFNLSFTAFPEARLSNLNLDAMKLRRKEIFLEEAKAIEQTLISLTHAKAELADVVSAESNATKAFQYVQDQFAQGKASLTDVIGASELVIGTAISRIGTRLKVDTQRVNLQRILIAKEFAAIPNCRLDKNLLRDRPFGWLESIFSPDRNVITVDQLCRARDRS